MAMTQRSTVVGVFSDRRRAQQAVEELRRVGFREDQIGVVAREGGTTVEGIATTEQGSKWEEGAATGAIAGAGVGGLWALGIAAGLLPAIGPVIAGGLLASVLASAAGGAAVASIVGALLGLGIPEDEAEYYEEEFKSGRILVTVKADGRYDEALAILRRFGAYDMSTAPAARAGYTESGQAAMQLREEELHARKQPVEKGEARVRKEVVTEHKTMEVPVTREEVVVERHPATGQPSASGDLRPGEEVRIPVREEQVHVEKKPVVKEEVRVSKRQVQDVEKVSGTVRKEEVRIEGEGDVKIRDSGTDSKDTGRRR
jgi:uncharacterized protein (TIGR02271 family)